MLEGRKTVVENEIKKEELNRKAEENKQENLRQQINTNVNQSAMENDNPPVIEKNNEQINLKNELSEGRKSVEEKLPPKIEGRLVNNGDNIIVEHAPVQNEVININAVGEQENVQNVQQENVQNVQQGAVAQGVQQEIPENATLQRVKGLLAAGKQVKRYHKSLKGWGSISDEEEAEVTESETTLQFIEETLANQEINLDRNTRERLTLLKGRYESHLLLNNFRYKSDSDEMKAVKDNILEVERLLAEKKEVSIPPEMVNLNDFQANEATFREKAGVYMPLIAAYQKAINACKNYCDNRDPSYEKGKQRKRDTENAMNRMASEMEDLMFGMQLVRRGFITKANDAMDLMAQTKLFKETQSPMKAAFVEKHKHDIHRNYSPESYLSTYIGEDQYKTMGKEGESVLRYIMSEARLDKLFKPGRDKRLSKDDMKLKNDLVSLAKELRAFPKDKYYSKTFVVGKTCFNLFQSENAELILTFGNSVYVVRNSAQVMADDIAIRFAADEEIFGKESVRELSDWMRDENLNLGDLQTGLRVDALGKEIIAKRLGMRKSDLANVPVAKIRDLALRLLDESLTADGARQEIEDIEDRVLEKQKIGQLKSENEELSLVKSVIESHEDNLAKIDRIEASAIKAVNDDVEKRMRKPYLSEYNELKRETDAFKKWREELNTKGEDEKEVKKIISYIEMEFNIKLSDFSDAAVTENKDAQIPKAPEQASISAAKFLDLIIKRSDKRLGELSLNIEKRASFLEKESKLLEKKVQLKKLKGQFQRSKLDDLSFAMENAEKSYDKLVAKHTEELENDIDALEGELDALNESHLKIKKDDKDKNEKHAAIRAQVLEKRTAKNNKQKELEAYLNNPESYSPEIAEARKNLDDLTGQYEELLKKEIGIEELSDEISDLGETVETLKESVIKSFYTDKDKEKLEEIKKEKEENVKTAEEVRDLYVKRYERLGGDKKELKLSNEIERMNLSEKDRLTDQLVNDELTRQKIKLYRANKYKYDKLITFKEAKEEKDEDAIVADKEKDDVEWTAEEQELKDLLADLIYDHKTWEMDEKKDDEAGRMALVLAPHDSLLLKILLDPSIVDRFFDKLPLNPTSEYVNLLYDSFLTGQEVTEGDFKSSLKKSFHKIFNKLIEENEEAKGIIDEINGLKEQIEDAKKEIEEEERKVKEGKAEVKQKVVKQKKEKGFFGNLLGLYGFGDDDEEEEEVTPLEKAKAKLQDLEAKLSSKMYWSGVKLFLASKDMLAGYVNEFQKTLDQYMSDEALQNSINECVDGLLEMDEATKTDTSKIPDPRNKNLSEKEKNEAIQKGNEALEEIIKESMQGSEGQGKFIKNIMKNYMTGITKLDVRSMMSSAIRNLKPVNPDADKKVLNEEARLATYSSFLGGALKGAGPLLQKMLQGIPDSLVPNAFKSSIKDMKSNLAPIPDEVVRAELASIIERSNGKIFNITVEKSLGAASVGQAFLCTMNTNQGVENVVVKILRPDVRNKMQREKAVMLKSAKEAGDGMYHSYKGMLEVYEDELDLTLEAKNCERGDIYNTHGDVKSMKVLDIVAPSTNSMVVKKAEGETIDSMLESMKSEYEAAFGRYFERDEKGNIVYDGAFPKLNIDAKTPGLAKIQRRFCDKLVKMQKAQRRMVTLAEKWVHEGVFGSGFYHGDLHAGNILNGRHELTVIDYGNATQLTPFQQTEITRMMVAAAAGDMEGFRDGFKKLLKNTSEEEFNKKKPQLSAAIEEVFRLGDKRSAGQRIAAALMKAQQLGFEIPTSVYNFSQCELRLQNTISEMNDQIKKYQNALGKIESLGKLESLDIVSNLNDIEYDTIRTSMITYFVGRSDDNIRDVIREKDEKNQKRISDILLAEISGLEKYSEVESTKKLLLSVAKRNEDPFEILMNEYNNIFLHGMTDEDANLITEQARLVAKALKPAQGEVVSEEQKDVILTHASEIITQTTRKYSYQPLLDSYRQKLKEGKDPDSEEMKKLEDQLVAKLKPMLQNLEKHTESAIDKGMEGDYMSAQNSYDNVADEEPEQKVLDAARKVYEDEVKSLDAKKAVLKAEISMEKMRAPLRDKLKSTDANMVKFCEESLQQYFRDKANHGDELKKLYDDFRTAQSSGDENADAMLERFLDRYMFVGGINRLLNENLAENNLEEYSKREPYDFLDVMGTVVNNNWRTALVRLGTKVGKYSKILAD